MQIFFFTDSTRDEMSSEKNQKKLEEEKKFKIQNKTVKISSLKLDC